jgi:dCMP deaminase
MASKDKWNKVWMKVARTVSELSKDPATKVGAVIVTLDNRQCSVGYNGFAVGIDETGDKWERPRKYQYVIHGEINAIMNCPFDTKGCKVYLTHTPCHRCIAHLVNAGITEVYFLEEYKNLEHKDIWEEHRSLFNVFQQVSLEEDSSKSLVNAALKGSSIWHRAKLWLKRLTKYITNILVAVCGR